MKDNKTTCQNEEEVERQLLPRLRFMGSLLIVFGFFAAVYGLFLPPPSDIDTPQEFELASGISLLSPDGRINAYGVATIFSVIGALCIGIAIKRSRA